MNTPQNIQNERLRRDTKLSVQCLFRRDNSELRKVGVLAGKTVAVASFLPSDYMSDVAEKTKHYFIEGFDLVAVAVAVSEFEAGVVFIHRSGEGVPGVSHGIMDLMEHDTAEDLLCLDEVVTLELL